MATYSDLNLGMIVIVGMLIRYGIPVSGDELLGCDVTKCLHYYSEEVTWNGAQTTCAARGMQLLSIQDAVSQTSLTNIISQSSVDVPIIWLGSHLGYIQHPGDDCKYVMKTQSGDVIMATESCDQTNKVICMQTLSGRCSEWDVIASCTNNLIDEREPVTWADARDTCVSREYTLGSVGSAHVQQEAETMSDDLVVDVKYWVIYTAWEWSSGGEVTYFNWATGAAFYSGVVHCMVLSPDRLWQPHGCDRLAPRSFICQEYVVPLTVVEPQPTTTVPPPVVTISQHTDAVEPSSGGALITSTTSPQGSPANDNNNNNNNVVLIGAGVGAGVFLILILIVVCVICSRCKNNKHKDSGTVYMNDNFPNNAYESHIEVVPDEPDAEYSNIPVPSTSGSGDMFQNGGVEPWQSSTNDATPVQNDVIYAKPSKKQ